MYSVRSEYVALRGLESVLRAGAKVVGDDVKLAVWKGCGDAVHEVEKLDTATAFRARRDDPSGWQLKEPAVVVAVEGSWRNTSKSNST